MSDEEVDLDVLTANGRTRRAIELWASVYDAFFQDFLEMGLANDKLGTMLAAARLAQLSSYCMAEFHAAANALADSPTEQRAGSDAAKHVIEMMGRQLAAIFPDRDEAPQTGSGDKGLN